MYIRKTQQDPVYLPGWAVIQSITEKEEKDKNPSLWRRIMNWFKEWNK
jgi:hypothetical protein